MIELAQGLPALLTPHPALVLLVMGALVIALAEWRPSEPGPVWVAALGASLAAALTLEPLFATPHGVWLGLAQDGCAAFFQLTISLTALGTVVLFHYSEPDLPRTGRACGLLLLSAAGLCVLAAAVELPTALLGAAWAALPLPFLLHAAGGEPPPKGIAAALVPCALLALSLALLVSSSDSLGTPRLDQLVLPAAADPGPWLLGLAVACGVAACALGLGSYGWASLRADVSPAAAAWLGALLAGMTGLGLRVLLGFRFLAGDLDWAPAVGAVAVAFVLVGHVVALRQKTLRAVVVWLFVAQSATLGLGLTAPLQTGEVLGPGGAAVALQLLALVLTHMGLLALTLAARGELGNTSFERLRGLARRNPWLGGFLALLLASAVGLPPTLGFAGKLQILLAGLQAGLVVASGLALLGLVLAAWIVLKIVRIIAFESGVEPEASEPLVTSSGLTVACATIALAVLWLGLNPAGLVRLASQLHLLAS